DQELRRLFPGSAGVRSDPGDQGAQKAAVVAVALNHHGRPLFRSGAVVEGDFDVDDIAALVHALSREGGSSASRTSAASGYISSTSPISSSRSRAALTRSNISLWIRTKVSPVAGSVNSGGHPAWLILSS